MEKIRIEIENILRKNTQQEYMSDVINGDDISSVSAQITEFIQSVFDPDNQPNQFGIENPFNSDFNSSVKPAIRYLLKNHDPHTKIYIDYSSAELLVGEKCINLSKEVPDQYVYYVICFNDLEGRKKYSDGSVNGTSNFYLATRFEYLEKARVHVMHMSNKYEYWIEDNIVY